MSTVKQVIVIRRKYPDGKGGFMSPRAGKICAQAAHASMTWLTKRIFYLTKTDIVWGHTTAPQFSTAEREWLSGLFTKVCLQVDTEEELKTIYARAIMAGLEVHMIIDAGKTEFGGAETPTAVAIGPDYAEKIDPITKDLKLY